ncbi:undecaprenyl-diphosphatase UppP [Desulforhopalus singaporensis]|uniref:Undecaprenyl-diphosphatase n=1 Tax=Desulforhopalus singaporensis TaxID=91360 RepID=A0A1H0NCK8_9BACT|nr:undecaprenyl-diphosphatase UppP [Desulforhopalus singaporensis]SDO90383.1 undecaprenyl-diphosphatase [Desulforhopalus singaporensis]
MLEFFKAVILGVVQGVTEFLPVSSSGHLVIGSQLMNFQEQGVVFDVCLHLGTLLSVLLVFRREIKAMAMAPLQVLTGQTDRDTRTFFLWDIYVIVATLPAVVVGLFFKDRIESLFSSVLVAYIMLIVTGILMICARYLPKKEKSLTWWRSVLVGCAQAGAILPGLSRSGSTIFMGMALGVPRQTVARFSFIMSIPAILGAVVLHSKELLAQPPAAEIWGNLAAGMVVAAVSGYLAIKFLLDIIEKDRLQWFGYYCLLLASAGLGYYVLNVVYP